MKERGSTTDDFMRKVEQLSPKDQKAILMVVDALLKSQEINKKNDMDGENE